MSLHSAWRLLAPSALLEATLAEYWLPLVAAAAWAVWMSRRAVAALRPIRPGRSSNWWSLPLLTWAWVATKETIWLFDGAEGPAAAMIASGGYLARWHLVIVGRGLASLSLVLLVLWAGLVAAKRGTRMEADRRGLLGVGSALLAVMLGYFHAAVLVTALSAEEYQHVRQLFREFVGLFGDY